MTIVYPYWLEKVFSANTSLFAGMAVRVWNVSPDGRTSEELAEIAIQEISNFWNEIGIARNIGELGLKKHDLSEFEPLIQKRHVIEGM